MTGDLSDIFENFRAETEIFMRSTGLGQEGGEEVARCPVPGPICWGGPDIRYNCDVNERCSTRFISAIRLVTKVSEISGICIPSLTQVKFP